MQNETDNIANRVRGIAAEHRFTQDRIANVLGMTRGAVNARMNGRVPFTAPEIAVLALALDVDVRRFFGVAA